MIPKKDSSLHALADGKPSEWLGIVSSSCGDVELQLPYLTRHIAYERRKPSLSVDISYELPDLSPTVGIVVGHLFPYQTSDNVVERLNHHRQYGLRPAGVNLFEHPS